MLFFNIFFLPLLLSSLLSAADSEDLTCQTEGDHRIRCDCRLQDTMFEGCDIEGSQPPPEYCDEDDTNDANSGHDELKKLVKPEDDNNNDDGKDDSNDDGKDDNNNDDGKDDGKDDNNNGDGNDDGKDDSNDDGKNDNNELLVVRKTRGARTNAVTATNGTDQQQRRRRTRRGIIHDRPCNEAEINGLCRELSELCKCACFWLRTDTNVVTNDACSHEGDERDAVYKVVLENEEGVPLHMDGPEFTVLQRCHCVCAWTNQNA